MLGKFNAGSIVICYIPFLIITPFISYFFAVHYKEQKPFPHATITQTACHYPQDIIVRYFMVMAGSILSLVFFIMFKWLAKAIKDSGFDQKISMGLYYLSQFSILMFSITLGTIDGKGTGPLHSPCAVIFFIILITQIVYITLLLTRIRQFQTNIISKGSLRLKQILAFINVAVWVYCLVNIIIVSLKENQDIFQSKTDKYVVIVQWHTVTWGLLWLLTWYIQWKDYYLCLLETPSLAGFQTQKLKHLTYSKREFIQHSPINPLPTSLQRQPEFYTYYETQ